MPNAPERLRKVVIAGHNLAVWMVIPPTPDAPDKAFAVHKQMLGPVELEKALRTMLKDQPDFEVVPITDGKPIDPAETLKITNPNGVKGSSPPEEAWLVWSLRRYKGNPSGKDAKSPQSIRIQDSPRFQSREIDTGHHKMTISDLPSSDQMDAATLVVVGLDLTQKLPKTIDRFLPPDDAGMVLLYLTAEEVLPTEVRTWLLDYIEKCRDRFQERLVILVSSKFFEALDLSLVAESSWEALVDSLVTQGSKAAGLLGGKEPNDLVKAMRKCSDVIVRHKAFSAIRFGSSTVNGKAIRTRRLFYLVDAGQSIFPQGGYVIGYNSLIVLSLIEELLVAKLHRKEGLEKGIRKGVYRSTLLAARGYATKNTDKGCVFQPEWLSEIAREPTSLEWDDPKENYSKKVHDVELPYDDEGRLTTNPNWSVFSRLLDDPPGDVAHAMRIARDVVLKGVKSAQVEHQFPVARFGEMVVTDRKTFEDYWEIHEAISNYLSVYRRGPSDRQKPISLAVFGAPGGGKSYGLKKLAEAIGGESLEKPHEVNVSQFTSLDDLSEVFDHVSKVSLSGKVPFVLFDEFDASWEDRAFGWLRYFLAPMQDGAFGSGPKRQEFLRAIFVFIGGVNHSFDILNGRMLNRDFIEAKGPDFVSRLARHLDVLGIDKRSDGDFGYLLRRALVLRDKVKAHPQMPKDPEPNADSVVLPINTKVLNALLGVDRFKHGTRSLEAIIQTSVIAAVNSTFHWGALPPPEQLEMHVSVRELIKARDRKWD
jgi:hypothetical protein